MLFPIQAGKWFALGFVAWLAHLGEGGSSSFNVPDTSGGSSSGSGPSFKPAVDWIVDHLSIVIMIAIVAILVGVALDAALLFLSSRARFMFIDNIVKDDAKVEEPWRRFADLGMKLFKFRFILSLLGLLAVLAASAVFLSLAWPELRDGQFGETSIIAAVIAGSLAVILGAPLGVVGVLVNDFVVPSMYLNDEGVGAGWKRMRQEIFRGRGTTIFLFYLVQLGLGLVVGVITLGVTCITCCIAALPYIGTVILLPLFVFSRTYVLLFIEQLGPGWQFFRRDSAEPEW